MNKKRVFIYAYAEHNFGDDLFIWNLVKRYPNTQFILFADKLYKKSFKNQKNIIVVDKYSKKSKFLQKINRLENCKDRIIQKCDFAVYIGGSIFMEYENWTDQYKWYQQIFDNERLFFIGCNWGPCRTDGFYKNMTLTLSKMRDVCFRDMNSYSLFSKLPNVRYAPDILFSTSFPIINENKDQAFISVIDCKTKEEGGNSFENYEEQYLETMIQLIKILIARKMNICLVSFCEKENDPRAINNIVSRLNKNYYSKIRSICYRGDNIDEILGEIQSSKIIIATRFHAAVLGLAARKPVLPIVYSDKTLEVLNDLEYEKPILDLRNLQEVNFDMILTQIIEENMISTVDLAIRNSKDHFKVLDTVLR